MLPSELATAVHNALVELSALNWMPVFDRPERIEEMRKVIEHNIERAIESKEPRNG